MPVYFMQDENTSLIKIGKADKNLNLRRKAIEREFSAKLHILGVVDGGLKEEGKLHDKFSNIRSHREWFEPSDELVEFIERYTRKPRKEEMTTPCKKQFQLKITFTTEEIKMVRKHQEYINKQGYPADLRGVIRGLVVAGYGAIHTAEKKG